MNFAEFPLSTIGTRAARGQKTLYFEDDIWDESTRQRIKRNLTVVGSTEFGLPTARDNDVLVALIYLTTCRNRIVEPKVYFSRYELVKFLRWDDGGASYRRLERSLNVLSTVALIYKGAWWDHAGKSWRSLNMHILESVDLRGREGAGPRDQPLSSITWNENVFSSFKSNYIKKLNVEVYFQLHSPAARQAYRFLDKKFYHERQREFELRWFACEHLGFSRSYDTAQLKCKLRRAIEELEEIGFLRPRPWEERFVKQAPGLWTIRLERQGQTVSRRPAEIPLDDLAKRLVERGVKADAARDLAESIPRAEIEQTLAKFDALPRRARENIKNPGGYLVRAIRRPWEPAQPATKAAVPTPQKIAERRRSPIDRKQLARQALWNSLSAAEQSATTAAAFAESDQFSLDGWRRADEAGSELVATGYRQAILNRHLDRIVAQRNGEVRK